MQLNKLYLGDNLEVIKTFPDNSIDAIITDSPYGLGKEPDAIKCLQDWIDHGYHDIKGSGFMGKHWDAFVPQPVLWKECFRVLKPGGHLLSFFGTRTYDWGTLAIRLAGFEIRDCVMWIYGSGFPKSLDISKAIDKAAGAERKKISQKKNSFGRQKGGGPGWAEGIEGATIPSHDFAITIPATDDAKQWNGYGTALKPACEPICVARKPLEGTVIENVLQYGTGGINIDAGRVEAEKELTERVSKGGNKNKSNSLNDLKETVYTANNLGRWPANIIHDGSEEVLAGFPYTKSGELTGQPRKGGNNIYSQPGATEGRPRFSVPSEGSAARFFYCAKTSPAERAGRKHPTIKPLALIKYLVKLFCPAGGAVLDPFAGSGTLAVACDETGHKWVCIEADPDNYAEAKNFIFDGL